MAERRDLVDTVADALIRDITSGKYPAGSTLPNEQDLAARLGVSRPTLRGAVKSLVSKSVVQVHHGRGMFVNPVSQWSALDPQLLAHRVGSDPSLPKRLIEARRFIEAAACELAATRCSKEDLENLEASLSDMTTAAEAADVEGFVRADLEFHQVILSASHNPFIAALFDPISQLLHVTRTQTSSHAEIRDHAIEQHRLVLAALSSRDPEAARLAMIGHMSQTEEDFDRYVVSAG
ncbi:FadR/GntR family transcriptional regulator [Streptomyces sp. NPDC005808]|uniref:FadR/GntR family transcriptional regulator n=1 Tax=Streptomyces sp. NPDC005808 TaxID=3364734 RepID=UPI00368E0B68